MILILFLWSFENFKPNGEKYERMLPVVIVLDKNRVNELIVFHLGIILRILLNCYLKWNAYFILASHGSSSNT